MRRPLSLVLALLLALAAMLAFACARDSSAPGIDGNAAERRAVSVSALTLLAERVDPTRVARSQATATVVPARDRVVARQVPAGVSALAAQVAADMRADNDDPNDLISVEFVVAEQPGAMGDAASTTQPGRVGGERRPPLRPPRRATA